MYIRNRKFAKQKKKNTRLKFKRLRLTLILRQFFISVFFYLCLNCDYEWINPLYMQKVYGKCACKDLKPNS